MTNLFETADFGAALDEWLGEVLNPNPTAFGVYFQDEDELIPSISTRFFVSEMFVHLLNLQAEFDTFVEKSGDTTIGEDLDTFFLENGFKKIVSDNTCNYSSDLTDELKFRLYVPEDDFDSELGNLYYCQDLIAAIQVSINKDLDGAYSFPLLVKASALGSFSFPPNFSAKFWGENDFSDCLNETEDPGQALRDKLNEGEWTLIEKGESYVEVEVNGDRHKLCLTLV